MSTLLIFELTENSLSMNRLKAALISIIAFRKKKKEESR